MEKERLIDIGDAASVILGIAYQGYDPDGSDFPLEFELELDPIEPRLP